MHVKMADNKSGMNIEQLIKSCERDKIDLGIDGFGVYCDGVRYCRLLSAYINERCKYQGELHEDACYKLRRRVKHKDLYVCKKYEDKSE